jgi:pimeloyl-ACP methyl ester carboxylesterase
MTFENDCSGDGEVLHCSVLGEGHPVVLIHGFAASNNDWVYLTPELLDNGYQVLAPDLIGHGSSSKPWDPSCYTYSVIYQHFEEWIETCGLDEDITLVGHSMGGLIALDFASHNPGSIQNLILIDPFFKQDQLNSILRLINRKPDWYQNALRLAPKWLIHTLVSLDVRGLIHYEERTRRQIAEDYKRASPQIVYIPGTLPDISNNIDCITSPTLVIWGTKDATLDPKSFPSIVASIPNGHGEAINGAGHQPHLAQPEIFNQLVMDFLQLNTN